MSRRNNIKNVILSNIDFDSLLNKVDEIKEEVDDKISKSELDEKLEKFKEDIVDTIIQKMMTRFSLKDEPSFEDDEYVDDIDEEVEKIERKIEGTSRNKKTSKKKIPASIDDAFDNLDDEDVYIEKTFDIDKRKKIEEYFDEYNLEYQSDYVIDDNDEVIILCGVELKIREKSLPNYISIKRCEGRLKVVSDTLEDLAGFPSIVAGQLELKCNNLKSLKYFPKKVYGSIYIKNCNKLKDLKGLPSYLDSNEISISYCESLLSCKGLPKQVRGDVRIAYNPNLIDLGGTCEKCRNFICSHNNRLKSLKGSPKIAKEVYCNNNESLLVFNSNFEEVEIFDCSNCWNLCSAKGAPKKVKEKFFYGNTFLDFDMIKEYCDIDEDKIKPSY